MRGIWKEVKESEAWMLDDARRLGTRRVFAFPFVSIRIRIRGKGDAQCKGSDMCSGP